MQKMGTLLILSILLGAAPARSAQLFDFDGQAVDAMGIGGQLHMEAVILNNSAITLPLPLDLANFQYTIVVSGLTLDSVGPSDNFSGGFVAIYEDNMTPATWANPGSFSDGTMILSGSLFTLQRTMFTSTLGSAVGNVDWTGGSRIGDLSPGDRLNWPFLVSVSRAPSMVQSGYDERWDGKVEPQGAVVSTEGSTWSSLKGRF